MPGERRKRQQRVRHEVGGAAPVPAAAPENQDSDSTATVASTAPTAAAKVAAGAPVKSASEGSRGGGGAGRGSNRGGAAKPGRRGVAVATVDESQYYQPVTIMESKPRGDADAKDNNDALDELDEAPRKYKRRAIVSNWSRYEQPPTWDDELDDGSDYLIGEDFSDVLTNQSLGSGGGGHLRLRGEEGWGLDDSVRDRSLLGLGALRVSDLVSTMTTVPLTMQLGIQLHRMPEQLADFYTKLADDSRRVYDPLTTADYVDDARLIEDQIRKLRLAFFDEVPSKSSKKIPEKAKAETYNEQVSSNSLESFMDEDIVGDLSTKIDFTEDLKVDGMETESENCKVDLTAKMCQAFGSNIKDVPDDNYADFVADDADLVNGAVDSSSGGKVAGGSSSVLPAPCGNVNNFNSSAESPTLQQLGEANVKTQSKSKNSSKNAAKRAECPGLDFSSGHQSFNFGLPKAAPASSHVGGKLDESLKDEDVFAPKITTEVTLKSSAAAQQIDLDAPIVPTSTAPATRQEDTKELEDWLDSVLDD